jgi:hypothetical protein
MDPIGPRQDRDAVNAHLDREAASKAIQRLEIIGLVRIRPARRDDLIQIVGQVAQP